MRAKILILSVIIVLLAACQKDKFSTRPQLTFKQVNATVFPKGSEIQFVLNGTDKQGNIKDTLWVQRISFKCPDFRSDSGKDYTLPGFIKKSYLDVEFLVTYKYGVIVEGYEIIDGCIGKDDSSYFRFWIKDTDNNTSDTVESPGLMLLN